MARWAAQPPTYGGGQRLPTKGPDGLRIPGSAALAAQIDQAVLPPTEAGWREFLRLAKMSGEKFTTLAEAGAWWWGRASLRELLSTEGERVAA